LENWLIVMFKRHILLTLIFAVCGGLISEALLPSKSSSFERWEVTKPADPTLHGRLGFNRGCPDLIDNIFSALGENSIIKIGSGPIVPSSPSPTLIQNICSSDVPNIIFISEIPGQISEQKLAQAIKNFSQKTSEFEKLLIKNYDMNLETSMSKLRAQGTVRPDGEKTVLLDNNLFTAYHEKLLVSDIAKSRLLYLENRDFYVSVNKRIETVRAPYRGLGVGVFLGMLGFLLSLLVEQARKMRRETRNKKLLKKDSSGLVS